ncbi:hypothetical protein [Rickettsiella endosymbiont of Dermanyssus gallinae]|uniref:hypothetical protein n=1 Tax=Rickettsiella endosymbiont of Dermanyssus gallinae TaxID=2856608 RepID=UPI001C52B5D6|nr:hypothetical protein [Rickettsiella endosymbiont of Dermanyssus gallinae]
MSKKIRSEQDSAWKDVLDAYFQEFTEFFYPDIAKKIDWSHGYTALDKELQSITTDAEDGKRFVDKLFKVKSLNGFEQTVLAHVEIQGKKEDKFPIRLFQYYYRLFELRKKPIITLAILTDDNKSWHPKNYYTEVLDFPVLTFNFQTHKLLDYQNKKQDLDKSTNPFAIVVLAHLAFIDTKNDPEARFQMKFRLTRRLYEKGYNRGYVINLFKVIDWILVIPRELALEFRAKIHELEGAKKVSYITSIEQLGREDGLKQGIQQGVEKGEHRRAIAIAQKMLADEMPPKAIQRLTGLSEDAVMGLIEKYYTEN